MAGTHKRSRPDAVTANLSLAAVVDFPSRYLDKLKEHDIRHGSSLLPQLLRNTCAQEVLVTSSYSGIGGAETAASMLSAHISSTDQAAPARIRMYSACERKKTATAVLQQHPAMTDAHIFGDILDRLPKHVRQQCLEIQSARISEWKELKRLGEGTAAKRDELGQLLFSQLSGILDAVEFEQEAFCAKHGIKCSLNVQAALPLDTESFIHVEAAGSTCLAWTSFGKSAGWLHESTLPCLVWCYSTRYFEPDCIIHENGPHFDEKPLAHILRGERRRGRRGPHPRNVLGIGGRPVANYILHCEIFCPTDLGVPSRRQRKYSIFVNASTLRFATTTSMKALFGNSQLLANAAIYMQDGQKQQKENEAKSHASNLQDTN